jgi:Putative phage abortive infection protein
MAQQAFDSAFFNLLERFSQVRDSVKLDYEVPTLLPERGVEIRTVTAKGRDAIERMMSDRVFERSGMDPNSPDRLAFLQSIFKEMYDLHESELGPYFRTLYHIFKFVDHGPKLTEQQKIDYANIARAQLSDVELFVIFYDGLTDLAAKFKPLIVHYGILKHVNPRRLFHPSDKTNELFYPRRAFQSQEEREATVAP